MQALDNRCHSRIYSNKSSNSLSQYLSCEFIIKVFKNSRFKKYLVVKMKQYLTRLGLRPNQAALRAVVSKIGPSGNIRPFGLLGIQRSLSSLNIYGKINAKKKNRQIRQIRIRNSSNFRAPQPGVQRSQKRKKIGKSFN